MSARAGPGASSPPGPAAPGLVTNTLIYLDDISVARGSPTPWALVVGTRVELRKIIPPGGCAKPVRLRSPWFKGGGDMTPHVAFASFTRPATHRRAGCSIRQHRPTHSCACPGLQTATLNYLGSHRNLYRSHRREARRDDAVPGNYSNTHASAVVQKNIGNCLA